MRKCLEMFGNVGSGWVQMDMDENVSKWARWVSMCQNCEAWQQIFGNGKNQLQMSKNASYFGYTLAKPNLTSWLEVVCK